MILNSMRKVLVLLVAVLVLAVSCSKKEEKVASAPAAPSAAPPASGSVEVGKPMPAYTAKSLDGKDFDIAAERGNVVLLNLWATWCGPCRIEIPELQQLHTKYAAQRFKVVGVSVDEGTEAEADVRNFVQQEKVTYPVALDPQGKLAGVFETTVLPTSALVDRKGVVVWKSAGTITQDDPELNKALQAALAN
jgi:cytochrome c biogenesis protein CcmG, thiol:disulfide interchange protein DsbE